MTTARYVIRELLQDCEIEWLLQYNEWVVNTVGAHLPDAVQEWMREYTRLQV